MTIREEIKEIAFYYAPGTQISGLVCPKCGGGKTKEKSLSINRSHAAVQYFCHRAQCNCKGKIPLIAVAEDGKVKTKTVPTAYSGKFEKLPDNIAKELFDKYALSAAHAVHGRLQWAPEYNSDGGRAVLPILTRHRQLAGFSFRSLDKGVKPKNIIQLTDISRAMLAWYGLLSKGDGVVWAPSTVVVVEDQLSALRASKFTAACALLGTHLTDEKILDIVNAAAKKVIIALDADATAIGAAICQKLGSQVNDVSMRLLKKDLKDCTDEEIKEVLKL